MRATDRIRSSTCRPQRCTHLLMLAAADCAHGHQVRVHFQAHAGHADRIADAFLRIVEHVFLRRSRAGSSGRRESRRPSPLRARGRGRRRSLRRRGSARCRASCGTAMWLPEMEAYTERISQPAISSASSTARWIDCTVDSMSTTTPRFMPARFVRADADHFDRLARRVFADQRGDLGGADVEADDQRFVALAIHVFGLCLRVRGGLADGAAASLPASVRNRWCSAGRRAPAGAASARQICGSMRAKRASAQLRVAAADHRSRVPSRQGQRSSCRARSATRRAPAGRCGRNSGARLAVEAPSLRRRARPAHRTAAALRHRAPSAPGTARRARTACGRRPSARTAGVRRSDTSSTSGQRLRTSTRSTHGSCSTAPSRTSSRSHREEPVLHVAAAPRAHRVSRRRWLEFAGDAPGAHRPALGRRSSR